MAAFVSLALLARIARVEAAAQSAASQVAATQVSPKCQAQLNTYCNDKSVPAVATCLAAMARDGYRVPLVALRGSDAQGSAPMWRCYSPSSLNANQTRYTHGSAYCTLQDQLAAELLACRGVQTIFPWHYKGVYAYRIPLLLNVPPRSAAAAAAPARHKRPPSTSGAATAAGAAVAVAAHTPSGTTLMAFTEARIYSANDRGPKHIALRRSLDGGATWQELQFIVSDNSTDPSYDGLNLGAAVYDPSNGRVTVLYSECAHVCKIAGLYAVASDDMGVTWRAAGNFTQAMVDAGVGLFAPGPGTGLAIPVPNRDNAAATAAPTTPGQSAPSGMVANAAPGTRLVVPGWYRGLDDSGPTGSMAFVSDDHGATWRGAGKVVATSAGLPNECQAAALGNGTLLLNMRNGDRDSCHCRLQSVSADGGDTWSAPSQTPDLPDPTCQGSIISVPVAVQVPPAHAAATTIGGQAPRRLYLSNADDRTQRVNGTLHTSIDAGATWQVVRSIDPAGFAYSGLAAINESYLGIVWEALDGFEINVDFMLTPQV